MSARRQRIGSHGLPGRPSGEGAEGHLGVEAHEAVLLERVAVPVGPAASNAPRVLVLQDNVGGAVDDLVQNGAVIVSEDAVIVKVKVSPAVDGRQESFSSVQGGTA